MREAVLHEEGPVRISATALVTPAGSWPLLTLGAARLRRVEPDVTLLQILFIVGMIALGSGLKGWWQGEGWGPGVTAAAVAVLAFWVWRAALQRDVLAVVVEIDGESVEVWRTRDEAAAERLLAAIESARPLAPVQLARA